MDRRPRRCRGPQARIRHLIARACLAIGRRGEAAAASLLRDSGASDLTAADRVSWRDRAAAALAHVLVPEGRPGWDEPVGPAHVQPLRLAEALEATRDGDLALVRTLRWPGAGLVRAHLPLPWAVELACAGIAAGNPPPDELLPALEPRARPALLALASRTRGDVAAVATRLASSLPAVPDYELRIDVLGPLAISRDGTPVSRPDLRRERVRELLSYLIARRRVRREEAAEELWPDLDDPGHNLRVTLSHLQKVLQPERTRAEPPFFLRAVGGWLELTTDRLAVDVWELDSHLDAADVAERANDPTAALTACRAAMELWRSEPYADVPYADWAIVARARLRDRYTRAAVRAGELLLAIGAHDEARAAARHAIAAECTSEPAYRLLIRAALAHDDLAGARRSLDECVAALAELGLEPDATTRGLIRA